MNIGNEIVIRLGELNFKSISDKIRDALIGESLTLKDIIGKVDDKLTRIANTATVRILNSKSLKTSTGPFMVYINTKPFYIEINLVESILDGSNDFSPIDNTWLHLDTVYELYDKKLHDEFLESLNSISIYNNPYLGDLLDGDVSTYNLSDGEQRPLKGEELSTEVERKILSGMGVSDDVIESSMHTKFSAVDEMKQIRHTEEQKLNDLRTAIELLWVKNEYPEYMSKYIPSIVSKDGEIFIVMNTEESIISNPSDLFIDFIENKTSDELKSVIYNEVFKIYGINTIYNLGLYVDKYAFLTKSKELEILRIKNEKE